MCMRCNDGVRCDCGDGEFMPLVEYNGSGFIVPEDVALVIMDNNVVLIESKIRLKLEVNDDGF